jgi:hypothetical protein
LRSLNTTTARSLGGHQGRRALYPPDTSGLAEQAKIENLAVKAYYCAIGCAFQGFS